MATSLPSLLVLFLGLLASLLVPMLQAYLGAPEVWSLPFVTTLSAGAIAFVTIRRIEDGGGGRGGRGAAKSSGALFFGFIAGVCGLALSLALMIHIQGRGRATVSFIPNNWGGTEGVRGEGHTLRPVVKRDAMFQSVRYKRTMAMGAALGNAVRITGDEAADAAATKRMRSAMAESRLSRSWPACDHEAMASKYRAAGALLIKAKSLREQAITEPFSTLYPQVEDLRRTAVLKRERVQDSVCKLPKATRQELFKCLLPVALSCDARDPEIAWHAMSGTALADEEERSLAVAKLLLPTAPNLFRTCCGNTGCTPDGIGDLTDLPQNPKLIGEGLRADTGISAAGTRVLAATAKALEKAGCSCMTESGNAAAVHYFEKLAVHVIGIEAEKSTARIIRALPNVPDDGCWYPRGWQ